MVQSTRSCAFPACTRPAKTRSFCGMHYEAQKRRGLMPLLPKRTAQERFWSKVDKVSSPYGCWIWTGLTNPGGYGRFLDASRRDTLAHRHAWELAHGKVPEGCDVAHDCMGFGAPVDNKVCILHLKVLTHEEHGRDKRAKGQYPRGDKHHLRRHPELAMRGENNGSAVLTPDQVREIRSRYAAGGVTYRVLARDYPIVWTTVKSIVRRKTWAHIE